MCIEQYIISVNYSRYIPKCSKDPASVDIFSYFRIFKIIADSWTIFCFNIV